MFVHADAAAMAAMAPVMARFLAELDALNAGYDEDGLRLVAGYLLKMAALADKAAGFED
ncbi:MAG: hypothetical protein WDN06_02350 [Asticcacaulis sp.]